MLIQIDCREKDLIEQIQCLTALQEMYSDITYTVERLDIGDIILYDDHDNILLIIERKTISDLLASICDKRYEEQSYRLTQLSIPKHHILYLIEGSTSDQRLFSRVNKSTYYSTLFSIHYYKGFSIIKSESLAESAIILCNMIQKIKKSPTRLPFHQNEIHETNVSEDVKSYAHVVKKTKKENIHLDNIDEIMLSQIPSVSVNTAIAIIKKFGSIQQLIQQYHVKEQDADIFQDIFCENEKGKKRKISKTSIQNIKHFLMKEK